MGQVILTSKVVPENTKTIEHGDSWMSIPHCFKPSVLPCIVSHADGSSSFYKIDVLMQDGWLLQLRRTSYDAEGKTVFDEVIATKDISDKIAQKLEEQ